MRDFCLAFLFTVMLVGPWAAVALLGDDTDTQKSPDLCQIQQQTQSQLNSVQSQLNAVQAQLTGIEHQLDSVKSIKISS